MTNSRIYVPYAIVGIFLILWGFVGRYYSVLTLEIALFAVAITLIVTVYARGLSSIKIIDAWLAGFLLIFFAEVTDGRALVTARFQHNTLAVSEAFITSAYGASLLGYVWFLKPLLHRIAKIPDNKPTNATYDEQPPIELVIVLLTLIVVALVYIFVVQTPEQLFATSRSQREATGLDLLGDWIRVVTTSLPIYSAYLMSRFKPSLPVRLIAVGAGLVSLVVAFAIGTRFVFGFAAGGVLFYLLGGFSNMNRQQKAALVAAVILFFIAQASILSFRSTGGVIAIDSSTLSSVLAFEDLHAEGILHINAWIHSTAYLERGERVPENLYILYWWIPRSIWPTKPTMAGYWFIREMTSLRGYSEGHSVSGGFAMPALMDFGPIWGVLFSILYGGLLALMEALLVRYRASATPISMIASLLHFATLFMVRSLHTSLINVMIASVGVVLPIYIMYRARHRLRRVNYQRND